MAHIGVSLLVPPRIGWVGLRVDKRELSELREGVPGHARLCNCIHSKGFSPRRRPRSQRADGTADRIVRSARSLCLHIPPGAAGSVGVAGVRMCSSGGEC